eukprot:CAMPEP_0115871310 /NCGR_PEP_ID=MMETSP0287-20121206/22798_1 /TAXON_ID=412157 /ORGANISM="Chrysochromulina rotalis, Strain UIO044" /LENGTH=313 /DNA_ID=CAMNT_0003326103 /DNA_START=61 /DNA_END=999 /DNA_ORIENTATION=-
MATQSEDAVAEMPLPGLLLRLPSVLIVSAVAVAAFWREVQARNGKVERPRAWTLLLVIAGMAIVFAILHIEHHPLGEPGQCVMFLVLPLSAVLMGAARYPSGVPVQDAWCIAGFFVIVAAASVRQTVTLWTSVMQPCEDDVADMEAAIRVRQGSMVLSSAAICAHALAVAAGHGPNFWTATRASILFAGMLRLATAGVMSSLGATGTCFPPTNLSLGSSIIVCGAYVLLALACTSEVRHTLSRQWKRFLCQAAPLLPRSQTGGLCVVCMDAPHDHAFISCGHLCTCAACARTIVDGSGHCPMCRAEVKGYLKT